MQRRRRIGASFFHLLCWNSRCLLSGLPRRSLRRRAPVRRPGSHDPVHGCVTSFPVRWGGGPSRPTLSAGPALTVAGGARVTTAFLISTTFGRLRRAFSLRACEVGRQRSTASKRLHDSGAASHTIRARGIEAGHRARERRRAMRGCARTPRPAVLVGDRSCRLVTSVIDFGQAAVEPESSRGGAAPLREVPSKMADHGLLLPVTAPGARIHRTAE